ncbi:putative nuclease HARBI1 [Prorops nasuta]|uniref:putative nuclease HARBI1 n=1 Tax=Prorops nasuta TaxID=863751 RepID=UPI0034CE231E
MESNVAMIKEVVAIRRRDQRYRNEWETIDPYKYWLRRNVCGEKAFANCHKGYYINKLSYKSEEDLSNTCINSREKKKTTINFNREVSQLYMELDALEGTNINKLHKEILNLINNFNDIQILKANEMNLMIKHICTIKKKLLFTIWLISKQESFLAVGDRFNIAPSSGHNIFKEIVAVLVDLMPQFIKWPDSNRRKILSNVCVCVFKNRINGFPNVIGGIDGCHIACKQPIKNAVDFYNRKGFHSIILQGICDPYCKFIDCFIGLPGRMHDATVFRISPIAKHLENPTSLSTDEHLLGDSAYPLQPFLLTPFKDTGHLSQNQEKYNRSLCSTRVVIERAFGLLKCKFRRLKYFDISDFQLGNKIIAAACVLHNFIIQHEGIDLEEDLEIDDDDNEVYSNEIHDENMQLRGIAEAKRRSIMYSLS